MTAEMKHMITVRMNKVEREQLRQAAELAKVSMNVYCRELLLKAAEARVKQYQEDCELCS